MTGVAGILLGSAISFANIPLVFAQENKPKKLSIYDDPIPEIVLIESPTKLEQDIRKTRTKIMQTTNKLEYNLRDVINKWIEIEQKTERTIKDVIDPHERFMPEGLYIVVAGLAGTIAARNPSYYFIPQTSHNISSKIREYEDRSPKFMKVHKSITNVVDEQKADGIFLVRLKRSFIEVRHLEMSGGYGHHEIPRSTWDVYCKGPLGSMYMLEKIEDKIEFWQMYNSAQGILQWERKHKAIVPICYDRTITIM
ncbi:10523_t:CDS:2, partial [Diversispora eburnea]